MHIFPGREYKSGSGWCFWRWTYTPSGYLTRLHLLKTPWFAVVLHFMKGPDPEPFMHDHPVSFLSIILRGGYVEKRGWFGEYVWRRWFNLVRCTDQHTIVEIWGKPITLCLMGPKVQEWGFFDRENTKMGWKEYNRGKYG